MRPIPVFLSTVAAAVFAAVLPAQAATDSPTSPSPSPPSQSPPSADAPSTPQVDEMLAAMREMHARMMAATTPEARQALMAEHMKTMQQGMAMMHRMGGGMGMGPGMGRGPMPGKGMSQDTSPGTAQDKPQRMTQDQGLARRADALDRRVDMLEMMMQLMVDRELGQRTH